MDSGSGSGSGVEEHDPQRCPDLNLVVHGAGVAVVVFAPVVFNRNGAVVRPSVGNHHLEASRHRDCAREPADDRYEPPGSEPTSTQGETRYGDVGSRHG